MTPDPRDDALAKMARDAVHEIEALEKERDSYRAIVVGSRECAEYWQIRARAAESSPTPYVRPAAEIRAEIERAKSRKLLSHFIDDDLRLAGRIEGLTFAITPPTQEPR